MEHPAWANWDKSIDAALRACASVLIVLSPDAVASDEVLGELRFALDQRKLIIPCCIGHVRFRSNCCASSGSTGPDLRPSPHRCWIASSKRSVSANPLRTFRPQSNRLFDSYLSWRASADSAAPYSQNETLRWLRRMATMLKKQGRSGFLIEQMQPEWLESPTERWLYRAGVFLVAAAVVNFVFRTSMAAFDLVPRGRIGRALESTIPAMFAEGSAWSEPLLLSITAAIAGVIASRRAIVPVETLTWSWQRAGTSTRRWAVAAALAGLDYGMRLGVIGGLIWQIVLSDATASLQEAGTFFGILGGGLAAAVVVPVRLSGIISSVRHAVMSRRGVEALICAALFAVIVGVAAFGLAAPFLALYVFGILTFSVASSDRHRGLVMRALAAGGICGGAIAAFSSLTMPAAIPLYSWLVLWAVGGLSVGFIAGLAVTLARYLAGRRWRLPTATATVDDGGSRWLKAIFVMIAIGTTLGISTAAAFRLGIDQPIRNVGLFAWWQAFLDFATRRRLLQRVGGRYRFIHILLRDHLSEPSRAPAAT